MWRVWRSYGFIALLSQDEALLSLLLPQGVASLRSLALGWELIAPSGRSLNAWFGRVVWTRGLGLHG